MCLCLCVGHVHMGVGVFKARGTGCSRDGAAGGCELPNVGDEN